MKKALRKRDKAVTEDPRQAGFVNEGRVEISAPVGGRQQAKIVWAVNTMTGEEVGKAGQENQVKAGSLNGPWGRIAEIVSNAAVSGIQKLFGIESRKSSRRSDCRNFPPVPTCRKCRAARPHRRNEPAFFTFPLSPPPLGIPFTVVWWADKFRRHL